MPIGKKNVVNPIPLPNPVANNDIWRQHQMLMLGDMAKRDNLAKQRHFLAGQELLMNMDGFPIQRQKDDFEPIYKKYLTTGVQFEEKKPVEDENNIFINIDYTCNILAMREINGKYGGQVVKLEDKEFIYDNQYEEEFMELYDKYYDILYQVKKDMSDK